MGEDQQWKNKNVCQVYGDDDTEITKTMNVILASKDMYLALKPLAKLAEAIFVDTRRDKEGVLYSFNDAEITYQDLRNALAALAKANPKQ